jgi:protein-disulfide isomerase
MTRRQLHSWIFKTVLMITGLATANDLVVAATPRPGPTSSSPLPVIEVRDAPVLGPADAPVTVVEFVDFQCPYCVHARLTPKRLVQLYPQQVRVVFKHFPLPIHQAAPLAHEAAVAAQQQGKFWEMREILLRSRQRLERHDLVQYAQQLDLDMSAFNRALDTRQWRIQVMRDMRQGRGLQVSVTPTYFINGKVLVGVHPISEFRKLIEAELGYEALALPERQ